MINPLRLDNFVAHFVERLPDSLAARKEDLATLLLLLPKNYPRRPNMVLMMEALRAHEAEQAKFAGRLGPVAQAFQSTLRSAATEDGPADSGDFPVPSPSPVPSFKRKLATGGRTSPRVGREGGAQ